MFHDWVAQEMAMIRPEQYIEPRTEFDPKEDYVVGEMSDGLKKLFTLRMNIDIAVFEAKKKMLLTICSLRPYDKPDDEEKVLEKAEKVVEEAENELALLEQRANALREAFWVSVRDEFPAANDKSLSVRKGFKVVTWVKEKEWSSRVVGAIVIPVS